MRHEKRGATTTRMSGKAEPEVVSEPRVVGSTMSDGESSLRHPTPRSETHPASEGEVSDKVDGVESSVGEVLPHQHTTDAPQPRDQDGLDSGPAESGNNTSGGESHAAWETACPLLKISELPSRGIELSLTIKGSRVFGFVDSGSSGNYIAEGLVNTLGLRTEPVDRTAVLADGKVVKIPLACTHIPIRFGTVKTTEAAFVFPDLGYDLILGMPWLERENPRISFKQKTVSLWRNHQWIELPTRAHMPIQSTVKSILNTIPVVENSAKRILSHARHQPRSNFLVVVREGLENPGPSTRTDRLNVVERGEDFNAPDDVDKLLRPDMPNDLKEVIQKHRGVFPKDLPRGLPPVRKGHEFKIDLEDEDMTPIHRPLYKLSPAELAEVRAQVDYLLEQEKIRPSESPWGAPILFVPKKDGGLRMCVDYRWINKVTVKNRYPLPLPEELMDRVGKAKYFTKLDLRSGYWQFPVRPKDTAKTAFRTRYGHFEFLVAPFGLTNCPAQFQTLVQDILSDFLDVFVVVFIDDILVYSKDMKSHVEHVRQVLERLAKHELYAKASKSELAVTQTDYLGYRLSGEGISPQGQKVEAVREWKEPTTVGDVRSFLGLASYYRKFIPQFSHIAGPLHDLTKKDFPWRWGTKERFAFNELKARLSSAPILLLPDASLPYTVITDASDTACGAVLMQDHGRGLQPIAYLSRRFRAAELNYAPYDKELCAVCYALVQWRHYLESCEGGCTVLTDHQPLTYLREQRNLSRTQARWLESGFFATIDPKISYIQGKANVLADALSRSLPPPTVKADSGSVLAISGWSIHQSERDAWTQALRADPVLNRIIEKLERDEQVANYTFQNGLLVHRPAHETEGKVVVPASQRTRIMKECHDIPIVGHTGLARSAQILKRRYWWKGWKAQLTAYIRECPVCQQIKPVNEKQAGLLHPLPIPDAKWEQVTTDLVTDLPESDDYTAVAVFVDRLTKFVHFAPCKKTVTAREYAQLFLKHVFRHHGLPKVIISDRDPRFTSAFWQSLFKSLGTELRLSSAYHPQTDGQSEVTIRTLENFLRPYAERNPSKWVEYLPLLEFAANNAVNASTGYSPAYLMYGRNPTVPQFGVGEGEVEIADQTVARMKDDLDSAKEYFTRAQKRMCKSANARRKEVHFAQGDQVMVDSRYLPISSLTQPTKKIRRRYVGPLEIEKVINPVAYRLKLPDHWKVHPTFHVSKLKRFYASAEPDRQIEPPAEILVDGEVHYEIETLLRARGPKRKREYLVLWKGYDLAEASWLPESELKPNANEVLQEFLEKERRESGARRTTRRRQG